jgi:hypothetical protein
VDLRLRGDGVAESLIQGEYCAESVSLRWLPVLVCPAQLTLLSSIFQFPKKGTSDGLNTRSIQFNLHNPVHLYGTDGVCFDGFDL